MEHRAALREAIDRLLKKKRKGLLEGHNHDLIDEDRGITITINTGRAHPPEVKEKIASPDKGVKGNLVLGQRKDDFPGEIPAYRPGPMESNPAPKRKRKGRKKSMGSY